MWMRTAILTQLILWTLPLAAQQQQQNQAFDVADLTAQLQLALDVEITSAGTRVVSSTVLYGAAQEGTAHADLNVIAEGEHISPTTMLVPDPRIAHDGSTLSSGHIILYVPFDPALKTLKISPAQPQDELNAQRHALVMATGPFGGKTNKSEITIDLKPLLRNACAAADAVAQCRAISQQ
jgi:hypothetical protein